jgi:DNA-binding transcriptional LysR family regulator
LKYALEVEKTGSITKAADRLYMNQPHLSKTIHELEGSLGVKIFKRTARGMTPTKKGAEFLACAKEVMFHLERMENLFDSGASDTIYFSISAPRASYVSYAFAEFLKSASGGAKLNIDYREANSISAIDDVAEKRSGIGIIRFQSDYANYFNYLLDKKNLESEPLWEFEYLVLFSKDHPLAGANEPVDCGKLGDYLEITDESSLLLNVLPQKMKTASRERKKRGEIAIYERGCQLEILNRVRTTYMWTSPVPKEVLSMFSLAQKKTNLPNNKQRDCLIFRKGYKFNAEDRRFVDKLNETINKG